MSTEPIRLDRAWTQQAMLLSAEAGWNQVAADWDLFMAHGSVLGVVEDGQLVATAAALPYGAAFGWISMVLVTGARRGRGLATRLVADCTAILRDAGRAALLDATPAGAAVYARLGFAPLCTMERWHGQGGGRRIGSHEAEFTRDLEAFGADRAFLLDDFMARPGSVAFGAPTGFGILRRGARAMHLGPIVADAADAAGLASAAIAAASGPVMIDVLEAGRALNPVLSTHGFTQQRPFTRMALGLDALPGNPARLLVAAGPEFG